MCCIARPCSFIKLGRKSPQTSTPIPSFGEAPIRAWSPSTSLARLGRGGAGRGQLIVKRMGHLKLQSTPPTNIWHPPLVARVYYYPEYWSVVMVIGLRACEVHWKPSRTLRNEHRPWGPKVHNHP